MNAAIKKKEYKEVIRYNLIKPTVARFIQFCLDNKERCLVDEICYDLKGKCAYIRCFDVQFSFHNISEQLIDREFIDSFRNKEVTWDGIRLQPIAVDLFRLAKEVMINDILDESEVRRRFHALIDEL